MRNRCSQFDMAHAFAAHLLQGHLNAAFFADNATILHALIFAAQTFVIFYRPKDTRAEQAVTLGLKGAVVDRLRLFDLAIRPAENTLRAGKRDFDLVKRFWRDKRVERVVREFLVHFQILEFGQRDGGSGSGGDGPRQPLTLHPPHPGVPC